MSPSTARVISSLLLRPAVGQVVASRQQRAQVSSGARRPRAAGRRFKRRVVISAKSSEGEEGDKDSRDPGPVLKAVWYAAEAFGDVVGLTKGGKKQGGAAVEVSPISRDDAMTALKEDYKVNYFISGLGEMSAYDPQCEFADPFVSFRGVDRFKKNVSNLGGLMVDVNLKISDWTEDADGNLITNWRFSCFLNLPWKPLLAAAGGTTHVFDPSTGRVVKHIERWDIEPGTVVAQLFKPGRPKGGSR